MKSIELGITFGYQIIIENVGRDLDPSLDPVLLQPVALGIKKIQVGDKTLEYSDSFRLYMTTTLPNPHYSPETSVKVTIINFAITPFGL